MGSLFKSPKAPAPMNVAAVGAQQAKQNTSNAYEQAAFNRVGQQDQYGNTLAYTQNGTDAQGNPQFQAQQHLGETGQAMAGGFGGLAKGYFDNAQSRPDLGSDTAMNNAYDAATSFSAPRQAREMDAQRTRLSNQGLDPSSEAYRNQIRDTTENQTSANNTLAAGLQNQMFQQGLANRGQQMSELNPGLGFASKTLDVNQANVPGVNVGNVDYAGLNKTAYDQQQQIYGQQMQQRNAMIGGLASLGGTAIGAFAGMPGGGKSAGGRIPASQGGDMGGMY